jgi:hypothetical protein
LEVSEAVRLALQNFHFRVKAFGDAVATGEAPHGGDLLAPGIERIAQGHQWGQPATTERGHMGEETPRQFAAAFLVTAFFQEQVGEPLFEAINRFQRGSLFEILSQTLVLFRA